MFSSQVPQVFKQIAFKYPKDMIIHSGPCLQSFLLALDQSEMAKTSARMNLLDASFLNLPIYFVLHFDKTYDSFIIDYYRLIGI